MAFFRRKKPAASATNEPVENRSAPTFTQVLPEREYDGLEHDDAQLRLWLPEACRVALDEVTSALDVTEATWLRITLLSHLYGEHEFRRMFFQKTGFFDNARTMSRKSRRYGVSYSAAPRPATDGPPPEPTTWVAPNLGKNMWPIKVFVPKQMKADLEQAANRSRVTLSVYVREVLINRLLGYALDRPPILPVSPEQLQAGADWEAGAVDDEEVPISMQDQSGPKITQLD